LAPRGVASRHLTFLSSSAKQVAMSNILIAVIIGCVSGIVAALCGVGGGVVMVPAFVFFLKMGQKMAVATSLAAIIITAIGTTLKNQANGYIDWKIAIAAGVAGGLIGWKAADLLKKLQDETLVRIFATVIIVFGVQMWVQSFKKTNLSSPTVVKVSDEYQKN
jgi:uncharacterized membrane protein YfcA